LALAEAGSLRLRILSALVLAPLPLVAIWFGGPLLWIVTIVAAAVMAWEWSRLCGGGHRDGGIVLIAGVAISVGAAALAGVRAGGLIALVTAGLVWWVELRQGHAAPRWMAAGALWVALPCIILLWLAQSESPGDATGRVTLLWVFALVWATDIGAYAIGRLLGGPRLAPRWSPRKTWTGLLGGVCCAAFAGWATARALGATPVLPLVWSARGLRLSSSSAILLSPLPSEGSA
jgi:phosphatidate cytidylyltransferase